MLRRINIPKSQTGRSEFDVDVDGDITRLEIDFALQFKEWTISITNNGKTLKDLHPVSLMPMNYALKNIHKYLIVPVNSFNHIVIGEADEFENGINNLFICDTEGYKELLANF